MNDEYYVQQYRHEAALAKWLDMAAFAILLLMVNVVLPAAIAALDGVF